MAPALVLVRFQLLVTPTQLTGLHLLAGSLQNIFPCVRGSAIRSAYAGLSSDCSVRTLGRASADGVFTHCAVRPGQYLAHC